MIVVTTQRSRMNYCLFVARFIAERAPIVLGKNCDQTLGDVCYYTNEVGPPYYLNSISICIQISATTTTTTATTNRDLSPERQLQLLYRRTAQNNQVSLRPGKHVLARDVQHTPHVVKRYRVAEHSVIRKPRVSQTSHQLDRR
jgi:hypothetical protein